jgi:hypothetical protein
MPDKGAATTGGQVTACGRIARGASGFYLVFAYIQMWSRICTLLDREKGKNVDVNPIDRSSSVVSARRRGVGIFSLARLASVGHLTWSATLEPGHKVGGYVALL